MFLFIVLAYNASHNNIIQSTLNGAVSHTVDNHTEWSRVQNSTLHEYSRMIQYGVVQANNNKDELVPTVRYATLYYSTVPVLYCSVLNVLSLLRVLYVRYCCLTHRTGTVAW